MAGEPRKDAEAPSQSPPPIDPESGREKLMDHVEKSRDAAGDAEQELWEGGYSPKAMIGAWLGTGVLTVVLIVAWAAFSLEAGWGMGLLAALVLMWGFQFARLAYRRLNVHYRLTDQRFFHETGVLRRVTDRIELIDMDDIAFEQGLVERFVGVGTIRVTSSDRTHPELVMPGIDDVKEVSRLIDDARRGERRRRGLHIESI